MKPGWLVVWWDRHTGNENSYAICEQQQDALTIAERYAAISFDHYRQRVETTTYGLQTYRRAVEDAYSITVTPQFIRGPGETA